MFSAVRLAKEGASHYHAGMKPSPDKSLSRAAASGIARLAVGIGLIGWALFWAAGTLDWPEAWWFLGMFTLEALLACIWLWRANPEIFLARRRFGKGTQPWDYLFFALIVLSFSAVLHVAGFDERLGWAPLPVWVAVLGHVALALGFAIITWAQAVNRHFEPSVRIQSERGHSVIDTGPYAIVRHPGYVGGTLVVAGMALALGSLWALLPAVVLTLTLVARTLFEERTLREGLPGYADYTRRVRFRWVPGVW